MAAYQAELTRQPAPKACPECGGAGFVRRGDFSYDHPDFGKIDKCPSCSEGQRRVWLEKNSGLSQTELGRKVAMFKPMDQGRQTAQNAIGYAIKKRTGFYTFWGDFGSGKSLALTIIANEIREQMIEVYYTTLATLLDHQRQNISRNHTSFWQRMIDIPVLCLDEVTRFNETGWAQEQLFILVDSRYRRRDSQLTVFATNDDPRQVMPTSENIGYLFSRMRDTGNYIIQLSGDMRGQ